MSVDNSNQFISISFVHKWGNLVDVCTTMLVKYECRQETFDVLLGAFTGD